MRSPGWCGVCGRTPSCDELVYFCIDCRAAWWRAGAWESLRATLAVKAIAAAGATRLMSVGLAGGCDPGRAAGSVVEAGQVIDALSGERYTGLAGSGTLVTTHTIASVREKQRLFAAYGAAVVDMEAATVARLAGMQGLPFRAVKAVSDAHDFELESLARFASRRDIFGPGRLRCTRPCGPRIWRRTMQLGAGSQRALRALTERLKEMIA